MLLGDDEPPAAVSALVARLTGALTTPVTVDDVTTRVGVSIGVSREPADTAEVDSLLSAADAAMYNRKRSTQAGRPRDVRPTRADSPRAAHERDGEAERATSAGAPCAGRA